MSVTSIEELNTLLNLPSSALRATTDAALLRISYGVPIWWVLYCEICSGALSPRNSPWQSTPILMVY